MPTRPNLTLHQRRPQQNQGSVFGVWTGSAFFKCVCSRFADYNGFTWRLFLVSLGLVFFFWCPLYALTFEADRLFILPPESPPLVYSKYDVEIWLFSRSDRIVSTCIILWQNGGCKSINSNLPILIQPRQKIENSFAGFCKVTDVHVLMMYSKRL